MQLEYIKQLLIEKYLIIFNLDKSKLCPARLLRAFSSAFYLK